MTDAVAGALLAEWTGAGACNRAAAEETNP